MKKEIDAAVNFLKSLISCGKKVEPHKVDLFTKRLAVLLEERFKGHWYPEIPTRGQAYRCLRMNLTCKEHAVLVQVCQECSIQYSNLRLPLNLTLWVDPGEVSGRIGEGNPHFLVASFSKHEETRKLMALNPEAPEWFPHTMALQNETKDSKCKQPSWT